MFVRGAPLTNPGVSFGKLLIGSEMDGSSHTSCWKLRAVNPVVTDEWFGDLRPDLD
jgi:hypothetical protein